VSSGATASDDTKRSARLRSKRLDTMKSEPERCGSSLASAASCGDAPGIELLDPEPVTTPGDTSAGQIIPAYVKSDQATLLGFVRTYLSFLRPTSLNRMIKAIERPQNQLFNRLYPEILNIGDGSYICLSNDLWAKGKSQGKSRKLSTTRSDHRDYKKGSRISPTRCASAQSRAASTPDRHPWKE